jgi:hypothetical protein
VGTDSFTAQGMRIYRMGHRENGFFDTERNSLSLGEIQWKMGSEGRP